MTEEGTHPMNTADKIEALAAKANGRFKDVNLMLEARDEFTNCVLEAVPEILTALRDAEALRDDAARYRWLRAEALRDSVPDEFHGVRYSSAEVDAYIDEARNALKDASHED